MKNEMKKKKYFSPQKMKKKIKNSNNKVKSVLTIDKQAHCTSLPYLHRVPFHPTQQSLLSEEETSLPYQHILLIVYYLLYYYYDRILQYRILQYS